MTPIVSIGLPVAQEPLDYIDDAIMSVLNQTLRNWELIVVADGSPHHTRAYLSELKDPRIRIVLHRTSLGLGARLNEIADLADAPFLARMDADDIMHPARLAHQISVLNDNPSVDLLSSVAVVIDQTKKILGITPTMPARVDVASMVATTPFIHPTVIARTAWWRSHRYDIHLMRSQDKALWITSARGSTFLRDSRVALFYRTAHHLDPAKYARTAKFERRIIQQYGPALVGTLGTARLVTLSLAKQVLVHMASRLGREDLVTSRRYAPLALAQAVELAAELDRALKAPDSGRRSVVQRTQEETQ